jgi:Ca2+-binding EF-hand superfamily protein
MTRFTHLGLATALVASLSGVAAARPIYTGPTPAEREANMLRTYDRNHNGVIDPIERQRMLYANRQWTREHYDMNDDGRLNTAEKTKARLDRISKMMAALDHNRDGYLSFAEVRVRMRGLDSNLAEKFHVIDTNDDRLLSRRELIASPDVQYPPAPRRTWWSYWSWGRKAPG